LSPENNTSTFTESGPRKEKKKPSKQQAFSKKIIFHKDKEYTYNHAGMCTHVEIVGKRQENTVLSPKPIHFGH
jgi:hypothetical protein